MKDLTTHVRFIGPWST